MRNISPVDWVLKRNHKLYIYKVPVYKGVKCMLCGAEIKGKTIVLQDSYDEKEIIMCEKCGKKYINRATSVIKVK